MIHNNFSQDVKLADQVCASDSSKSSIKKNVRSLSQELRDFFYDRVCPYLQKHNIIPNSIDPFTEISLNTNFLDKFSQGDLFTGYLFPLGHLVPGADNKDKFIPASFLSGPSYVKYHLLFYISTTAASYSSLDNVSSIKMFLISNLDLQNYFESHDISFDMLHGKANEVIRNCNRVNKDNLTLSFDRLFPKIVDIGEIACRMYVDDNEVGLSFPKRFLLDHFRTYDFANGILLARHDSNSWYLKTATKDDSFSTIWLSSDHCTEEFKL